MRKRCGQTNSGGFCGCFDVLAHEEGIAGMTDHVLDDNTDESSYFARQNKNGKAAYRRAVTTLTGGLPQWAKGLRVKVVTQDTKVVTLAGMEVVTVLDYEFERSQPGYVDPLTLL
jgi:hypothetical protein